MKSTNVIHTNSIKLIKPLLQKLESSPYLKPISKKSSLSSTQNSVIIHRRKRTITENPSDAAKILAEVDLKDRSLSYFSKSCETPKMFFAQDMSFESLSTACPLLPIDCLSQKLEDMLAKIAENDYQGKFDAYSSIFYGIIAGDPAISGFLEKLKEGMIESLKRKYKEKFKSLEKKTKSQETSIENLKSDKENLIIKLNRLSSQNIDLMKKHDTIEEKCQGLEETVKYLTDMKGSRIEIIDELHKKSDKIKEISRKLEEMHENEKKFRSIFQRLKEQGVNFEKIYNETYALKEPHERKPNNKVPALKINSLKPPGLDVNNTIF